MGLSTFIKYVIAGIPIGITFIDTVGTVARVEGVSMQPVLNPNVRKSDYVFMSSWAVKNYDIRRGDIVAFVSPKRPDETLIKRVIGLEGDYIPTLGYTHKILQVPDGHCWVEGDNITNSRDSNTFGPVSVGLIKAKATCIVWPPSRWQLLDNSIPHNRMPINIPRVQV